MSHKKSLLLKILVLFYRDPYFMVFERIPIYITRDCWFIPGILYPHQPGFLFQTLGIPDYFKACDTIHFTTFVDGTGNLDSEENNRRMMTDRSPFLGMLQKAQELHFPRNCAGRLFSIGTIMIVNIVRVLIILAILTMYCIYNPGTKLTSICSRSTPPKQGRNSNQNKGHLGSRYI